ncbi:fungal transcriptional regulatory protein [Mariannaea sp. PMI_226]|nr:fungal transcriptional regulatory protein [Mariannaea sp. PMI_226]
MSATRTDQQQLGSEQQQQVLNDCNSNSDASNIDASSLGVACFSCRRARLRCDQKMPCSRCAARDGRCRYPSHSNRGRKKGSTNKPVTVEKLLSRINESPVRDQVVTALLASHVSREHVSHPSLVTTGTLSDISAASNGSGATTVAPNFSIAENGRPRAPDQGSSDLDVQGSSISPLHIVAAAITANTSTSPLTPRLPTTFVRNQTSNFGMSVPTRGRLARYFAPQTAYETDWQMLDRQTINSSLRLETTACDPVKARLIDQDDVSTFFNLFYKIRNPFVGLLDPMLHTSEYVHSLSFTLFSVVCALGCAVSTRPRDRILYPTLLSLAESNVQWSIALSVKSLETIQAIVLLQYWAPISETQAGDPYWLHLSHAVQLARDIGIHRGITISDQVKAVAPNADSDSTERLTRNFERTWLFMFLAEKSFGIITGRSPCVSWKEIPLSVAHWWRRPMTGPSDRVISGIAEIRCHLLNALEDKKGVEKTITSVFNWYSQAFQLLCQVRNGRCVSDNNSSAAFLPILAFYMDHTILVLSTQALRELNMIDGPKTSRELKAASMHVLDVAGRLLDLVLLDRTMQDLMMGFHNNQFIMICHAVTELVQLIKSRILEANDVAQAASRVRAIPAHMETLARNLPATSAAHLYSDLCQFFAQQLDIFMSMSTDHGSHPSGDQDNLFADWWKAVEVGSLDSNSWFDTTFLGSEGLMSITNDFNTPGELGLNDFRFS